MYKQHNDIKLGENMKKSIIKRIINEIVSEEVNESNIQIEVNLITIYGYYKKIALTKTNTLLKKATYFIMPMIKRDFTESYSEKRIVVFLKKYNVFYSSDNDIIKIIRTTYHELRYIIKTKYEKDSYENFVITMERLVKSITYFENYDNYYTEIDANIYSIVKTIKYLKNSHPKIYKENKDKLEVIEEKYMLDYLNYNPTIAFDNYIAAKKTLENQNSEENLKLKEYENNTCINIFFNENYTFKPISEIINNGKFFKIDKRITSTIFSSKSFINYIDFEKLSSKELKILKENLKYTKDLYENEIKFASEYIHINDLEALKTNHLITKLNCLIYLCEKKDIK